MRQRRRRGVGLAGVLLSVSAMLGSMAGCGEPQVDTQAPVRHVEVSKKHYAEPAALARDAEVIVRGTVRPDPESVVDDGGSAGRHGIPSLLYTVEVTEQAPGSDVGDRITVLWVDTDKIEIDGVTALRPDRDYVLFLDRIKRSERGGLQDHGTLYTPVGLNSGVFRIESDKAVPTERDAEPTGQRSEQQERQRNGGLVGDLLKTVGVDELLDLVPGEG